MRRSMALNRQEFLRILPGALASDEAIETADEVTVIGRHPDRSIVIALRAAAERRLGALRLPVLEVKLAFHGYTETEREAFLDRFSRTFQRGGG